MILRNPRTGCVLADRVEVLGCAIDRVDIARSILSAGADKISVNSPALRRPELIAELGWTGGEAIVVRRLRQTVSRMRWIKALLPFGPS